MKQVCLLLCTKCCQNLDEWLKHYFDIGINHIFIVDNNDEDKKIKINDKNVTVLTHHDLIDYTDMFYHDDTLKKFIYNYFVYVYNQYDYMLICDDDEFLNIGNYNDIHEVIEKYNDYDSISFFWDIIDDNGYIYISDEPKEKSLKNIYINSKNGDNQYDVKTMYKLPALFKDFDESIKKSDKFVGIIHNLKMGKCIEVPFEECNMKHYITYCLERFLKKKSSYNCEYNFLKDSYLYYFLKFNDYSDEKMYAYIDLCKKYNIKLSEKDKNILDKHNIKY